MTFKATLNNAHSVRAHTSGGLQCAHIDDQRMESDERVQAGISRTQVFEVGGEEPHLRLASTQKSGMSTEVFRLAGYVNLIYVCPKP